MLSQSVTGTLSSGDNWEDTVVSILETKTIGVEPEGEAQLSMRYTFMRG